MCYYSSQSNRVSVADLSSQMAWHVFERAVCVSDFPRIKHKAHVFVQIRYNLTFISGSKRLEDVLPMMIRSFTSTRSHNLCVSLSHFLLSLLQLSQTSNHRNNVSFQPTSRGKERKRERLSDRAEVLSAEIIVSGCLHQKQTPSAVRLTL